MNNRVYTTGEVAAICGVSADTVSRWFDLGQIEGYRLGSGGDRRIPHESLRSFMRSHGIPADRLEEGHHQILVVDDDPFYLDAIVSILEKNPEYKVHAASTGFDAGALVAECNPQLVVLDIHLSDMDGRMVCGRIKARPDTQCTRILGISGFTDEKEQARLPEYGFDDFLRKPFPMEALVKRVQALLEGTDAPSNAPVPG